MRTLRFLLFLAGVMTASASAAENVSSCPGDTVPIQIMMPGYGVSPIKRSAAEIPNHLPHFQVFVTAVTEHVAARLVKDQLCMDSAESKARSLLQFEHWRYIMFREYIVPEMDSSGASLFPSCRISSPWMDLIVDRSPVPLVRGIVYWNDRQLLADQAVLAGARHVPPGRAMPLSPSAEGHFRSEYRHPEIDRKPLEERVPPDILWLLRRVWPDTGGRSTLVPDFVYVRIAMHDVIQKGAAGYTQLVLTLIDRCFDSSASGRVDLHYDSILDIADPVLLDLYKIDTPRRRSEQSPGEVS